MKKHSMIRTKFYLKNHLYRRHYLPTNPPIQKENFRLEKNQPTLLKKIIPDILGIEIIPGQEIQRAGGKEQITKTKESTKTVH